MLRSADLYLEHLRVERHLSPRTIEAYARDLAGLRKHIDSQGIKKPQDIRTVHISRWLRGLSLRGLSPNSQARALSAIRQYFSFLVKEGRLPTSPVQDVHGPRRRRSLPLVPSRQQMGRLVSAPKGDNPRRLRDRAMLELLYASGLRATELCQLRSDEIHMTLGIVRPTGKGGKERVVPMGAPAQAALHKYLSDGRRHLLKGCASHFVFIGNKSKPLSRMGLFKIVRRYALEAGIEQSLSPHKFRHAFATHLLQGGADLRSVQEMLGHADISTTEIYTHVDERALRQAVDKHHPLAGIKS
jgi:integrase/recombinase XerD